MIIAGHTDTRTHGHTILLRDTVRGILLRTWAVAPPVGEQMPQPSTRCP